MGNAYSLRDRVYCVTQAKCGFWCARARVGVNI